MYQLFYYPLNASMAPHFILEELQVPFELHLVDRKTQQQKSTEYLKLNPTGRIPTLVDDGNAIFESPAICIHLAESHIMAQLIPDMGTIERAEFFQWMMYLTNTLQAELMIYFYPEKHTGNNDDNILVVANQEQRIGDMLVLLDSALKNKTYLIGNSLTVCDFFLFMLAVWCDEFKKPPLSYPNLARYLKHLAKRKSIISVCKKEQLSLADYH